MPNHIISVLKAQGAAEAKLIPIGDIVLDPRVRLKCRIPLCDSYNRNLMCPPRLPSLGEFSDALRRYAQALLIQVASVLPKNDPLEAFVPAEKLHDLVNMAERLAFEKGFRFAAGLIGGCCRLCEICQGIQPGAQCRFPFKARPSMEAMGIDVVATLEKAGLTCSFPVVDHVVWTGLLLL